MGRIGVPPMPEQFNDSPFETGHSLWASVYVVMVYGCFDMFQDVQWCYSGISRKKAHMHSRSLAILYEMRRAALPIHLQAVDHLALIQALLSTFLACNQAMIRGHRPRSPSARTAKLPSWKHNWTSSTHVPNDIVYLSAYPGEVLALRPMRAQCAKSLQQEQGWK